MAAIRITKDFDFEMAHALLNHDGACKHVHGHSYKLSVTIKGEPLNCPEHPHDGMVMDFKKLKQIVKSEIVEVYDHAFVISSIAPYQNLTGTDLFDKIIKVPYNPTCENMVVDFAQKIQQHLPDSLQLVKLKLNETATSYAEWLLEDQDK